MATLRSKNTTEFIVDLLRQYFKKVQDFDPLKTTPIIMYPYE